MAYPTVSFLPKNPFAGLQPINDVSSTAKHPLGMTISGSDITYGEGSFIYLKGATDTAAGDLVTYDSKASITTRAIKVGAAITLGPCAIAMAAIGAAQYGWYQISGSGPINSGTVVADSVAYVTGTAGRIDDAVVGDSLIDGMIIKLADSGGFATVQFDRPCIIGGDSGTNTGDVTLAVVGAAPNSSGMTLVGQVLNLEPASGSEPGIITTGTQTVAGAKTFTGNASFSSGTLALTANTTNTITSGISAANASSSVGAFTFKTTNALDASDLVFDIQDDAGAHLLKVDKGGLITALGNLAGANLSGNNSGDLTVAAFGASPNGFGASLAGQVLTFHPADATNPGGLSILPQNIGGAKTFLSDMTIQGGTLALDKQIATNLITSNTAAAVTSSTVGAFTVKALNALDANDLILDVQDSTAGHLFKIDQEGDVTALGVLAASNLSGTNTGDVTLAAIGATPSANGASILGQQLTLQPADGSNPGVLTSGTQTIGGAKTFSGAAAFDSTATLSDAKPTSVGIGSGFTTNHNGRATIGWLKVTIDKSAWVAAALTQDITLCTIPARTRIKSIYLDTTEAYAGLAGTIQLQAGTSAGGQEMMAIHDVKTATVTKGLADADMGTSMTRAAMIQGSYVPSWSGSTTLQCRLTSGTGDIGNGAVTNLSTGSTSYYIQLEGV